MFFADLISRQDNLVHLQNDPDRISQEWAELLSPAHIKNIGAIITAENLNDYLLAKPKSKYLDCFAGSSFYSQNTTRYFNLKPADLQTNVPRELNFLANLYAAWNNEKITSEQYYEAEKSLRNFPATALAKKVSNKNLLGLRKKQFDLKIHSKLKSILFARHINILPQS